MAGKRRNSGFTVSKRADGRWMARVFIGYQDGKQVRKTFYGKTEAEVTKEAREFKVAHDAGGFAPTTRDATVAEWLNRWLEVYVSAPTHAPKTIKSYTEQTRNHIIPSLGQIQLRKLTPQHVQHFLRSRLDSGLSSSSVNGIHRVLRAALSRAEKDQLVARNVAKLVQPPPVSSRSEKFFTPDDLRKLFEQMRGHYLENLFKAAPFLGMRLGEMTGLRWKDVSFEKKELTVNVQLQRNDGKFEFRPPKSRSSKRIIPIDDVEELLKSQRAMHMLSGFANPMDLVFLGSNGNPLDPKLVNSHLKALCRKAGISELSFHSFRHTTATLMLSDGEEAAEVMSYLGHSQISLTVNTYKGVLKESQRRAQRRIRKVIEQGIS